MKRLTILVTGGSGFIGHHLIRYFSNREYSVFNADITSTNPNERIDIHRFENLKKVFDTVKPDVIVHLVTIASVPQCEESIEECFETKVKETLNVARLCYKLGGKFIFASSFDTYGNTTKLSMPVSHPLNPVNFYGLTKALGEQIVRYYSSSHVIFKIFNAYGSECYRSYVISDIIRKVLSRQNPIPLLGTGEEFGNFIYIDNVLEVSRIATKTSNVETFNLGSGKTYKIKNIAQMILEYMNKPSITFVFEGRRARDFVINRANISGNNTNTKWSPSIDIKTGLGEQ